MTIRYTQVANEQLDELEARAPDDLWNDIVDTIDRIGQRPQQAYAASQTFTTVNGLARRTPVPGQHPWKIFWGHQGDVVTIYGVMHHDS